MKINSDIIKLCKELKKDIASGKRKRNPEWEDLDMKAIKSAYPDLSQYEYYMVFLGCKTTEKAINAIDNKRKSEYDNAVYLNSLINAERKNRFTTKNIKDGVTCMGIAENDYEVEYDDEYI